MALRWADNPSVYRDATDIATGWTTVSSTGVALDTTGADDGDYAFKFTQYERYIEKTLSDQTEWTVGCRFRLDSLPTGFDWVFQLLDSGGTAQVSVCINSNGNLLLYRGTSSNFATSTLTLTTGVNYHFEWNVVHNNSTGTSEVRLDNVEWVSYTGDTLQTGSNSRSIRIGHDAGTSTATAPTLYVWDIYILDGAAGVSGFLGQNREVAIITPNGAGTHDDFTDNPTVTNNWENVDGPRPDLDDTYLESSTVGHKILYAATSLPTSLGTVDGVIVDVSAKSDDGGARGVKTLVKEGATESASADQALTSSYKHYTNVHENNPDTAAAWTKTEVNAMEIGAEVGS